MWNLVIAADEVDNISGRVCKHSDRAAVYERRQRLVYVYLSLWDGEHDVDSLLGKLLR